MEFGCSLDKEIRYGALKYFDISKFFLNWMAFSLKPRFHISLWDMESQSNLLFIFIKNSYIAI